MGAFDGIAPQAPSMEASLRRETGDRFPIRWLPCFPEPPASGITARLGIENGVRLAYFGRIERYKGVHLVLEAMAASDRLQNVSFDVWGGGGDTGNLVSMAEGRGLGARVRFRGHYPEGREGGELMASYHALVLPTTGNEGLPLILLEAMAYGLPLLATSVAAIPDCCVGNPDAVMVEPTVDGLRAGLETLVRKLEGQEFVPEREQRFYAERFSHDAMAARWRTFLADPPRFFT
jgi:glycosyltransferase involved in cell wall biosynthesis